MWDYVSWAQTYELGNFSFCLRTKLVVCLSLFGWVVFSVVFRWSFLERIHSPYFVVILCCLNSFLF